MEGEDNILDVIYKEDSFEDVDDDVEMLDVEEGELLDHGSQQNDVGQSSAGDVNIANQESQSKNRKRRANKKKSKKKRKGSGFIDVNRFYPFPCWDDFLYFASELQTRMSFMSLHNSWSDWRAVLCYLSFITIFLIIW